MLMSAVQAKRRPGLVHEGLLTFPVRHDEARGDGEKEAAGMNTTHSS